MKILRELIAVVGLLFAIFGVIFNYHSLPRSVPTHFGVTGVADRWGDKTALWDILGLACLLYAVLSLVRFLPPKWMNVPVTEEHRTAAIPISLEMVGWVKAEITCMLAYIVCSSVAVVHGHSQGLGVWFLPVTLVTIIGTSLFYTLRMMRLGRLDADIG